MSRFVEIARFENLDHMPDRLRVEHHRAEPGRAGGGRTARIV
jgi:hypothetical protein